jgi:membrane associated rhomboid family serine protease
MIPLKDDNPSGSTPFVTIGLIAVNLIVFLYELSLQAADSPDAARVAVAFVSEFGMVPCRLADLCKSAPGLPSPVFTIFSSMFIHALGLGGFLHVGGNMLYLWIFGNNVEDTLGRARFLVFYLAAGVAAALTQTAVGPSSDTPMIGASGAVSGVLGAYLLLFPRANILTVIVFGFFFRAVRIPAMVVLGFWFVVQVLNGLGSFGASGGVAFFAHIGGFLAGMGLLRLFRPRPRPRPW